MTGSVKRIAVLGSTGSIGRSALDVVAASPGRFEVVGLAARRNARLLLEQASRFRVARVILTDSDIASGLSDSMPLEVGLDALTRLAADRDVDVVLNAVSGSAGLPPAFAAVSAGARMAIANKESLVAAGGLLKELATETGAEMIPVDSEHSAVYRCMRGMPRAEISGITLTASGGPLRDLAAGEAERATVGRVLEHPTWDMGPKVTVDSATLVNKALEVIEARWLFDIEFDRIDVVVHRESVVHSMVLLSDGSMMAHLGAPDMRVPIQYALSLPDAPAVEYEACDLAALGSLSFEELDESRYPCFGLVLGAAKTGGTAPAVAATADEVAVEAFLTGAIGFGDIARVIESTLNRVSVEPADCLDAVLEAECEARREAEEAVAGLA